MYSFGRPIPIDPNLPAALRAGSAQTEPQASLCRTAEGAESIRVAYAGDVAVRITIHGYDILVKDERLGFFTLRLTPDDRRPTRSLPTLGSVEYALQQLQESGPIRPRDASAIRKQLDGWPKEAVYAWGLLHRYSSPLPPFAPEGLADVRHLMRGQ
jgi:hypothetical protein